jgi:hypothetical protein
MTDRKAEQVVYSEPRHAVCFNLWVGDGLLILSGMVRTALDYDGPPDLWESYCLEFVQGEAVETIEDRDHLRQFVHQHADALKAAFEDHPRDFAQVLATFLGLGYVMRNLGPFNS